MDSPEREISPVGRVVGAFNQSRGYELVDHPGRIRGMNPHVAGHLTQVERAAAGNDHEHPELDERHLVLDRGDRLRHHRHQHP